MSNSTIQYSPDKLKKFKTILNEKLKRTTEDLEGLIGDRKERKERIANANVDYNQTSSHFQQQAKNGQFIRRLQRKSRELKAALNRIEEGTYGICERSGGLIREERLMAMPTAKFDILKK